jgi:hypothetical protein
MVEKMIWCVKSERLEPNNERITRAKMTLKWKEITSMTLMIEVVRSERREERPAPLLHDPPLLSDPSVPVYKMSQGMSTWPAGKGIGKRDLVY